MTSLLIGAVRFYQTVISPGFSSGSCRFYPSCSQYAIDALQKYYRYYGDDLEVECPTGSGTMLTLNEVAGELA